MYMHFVERNL